MELKKGYKQTEVGVIPSDWEVSTIEELVSKGLIEKPMDGNHGNIHPKGSDFVDSGIPFVMANNVSNGHVDLESCHFIRKEQADNLQKGFSVTGDVLFTHKGTVGNVAIVGEINTPYIMLTPQVTYYRVKNFDAITNSYINQYFLGDTFQKIIKGISGGGTRAYIGITSQRQLPFILPPTKYEQTAIATALSDADALITSLEKLIAKKRNIKQGAMQQLLKPKKGWVVKKLGKILESTQLGGNYPNTDVESDYPLIKMGNLGRGSMDLSKLQYVANNPSENDRLIFGDLLFNTRNTLDLVGKVAIWRNEFPRAYFNSNIMRMRFKPSDVSSNFIMNCIFNSKSTLTQLRSTATGTTSVAAIYTRDLIQIELSLPSLEEQLQAEKVLNEMDTELSALELKLTKFKYIKQGMMQNLLSGKIRLV